MAAARSKPKPLPFCDFGEHAGITYLVMRYLQAGTVRDIVAHGPLPLPDIVRLINDIAYALDYAHVSKKLPELVTLRKFLVRFRTPLLDFR